MAVIPHLDSDGVHVYDGVDGVERAALPDLNLVRDGIGDTGNQAGRDINAVDLFQVPLDLAGGHPPGIEGDDLVVKAGEAGLAFGDDNRLEAAVAVAWNLNRQLAKFALDGFR